MSVVRRQARRRWLIVLGAVVSLCALPAVVSAIPVPGPSLPAAQLRDRILASTATPYQGLAESRGSLGLPDLPGLGDVSALLGGTTRIRAWYASADHWRVAVIVPTGERDLYRSAGTTTLWDYERALVTDVIGDPPVRLPRASDLLPPELARRLLAGAAPDDTLRAAPSRRVAGVRAAGLRLSPADPESLVGRVEVWAEESSGLPLEVRVTGRDGRGAVLVTRFLDLDRRVPPASVLAPVHPPGASRVTTGAPDLAAAMNRFAPYPLPATLAGRPRVPVPAGSLSHFQGVGGYGSGLSTFVVLPLPGRLGYRSMESARRAGATPVQVSEGTGVLVRTSVLTALIVRSSVNRRAFLLAGLVTPDLLATAAGQLLATRTEP